MLPRKNPKLDLEKYKTIFFLVGLNMALLLAIMIINVRSYPKTHDGFGELDKIYTEQDVIPITRRELPPTPPPPIPEIIEVVDNAVELDEELDIASTEIDQMDAIDWNEEVVDVGAEEEVSEEILNFAVVESVPVFPGCEWAKDNNQRKACFQEKILTYVKDNFEYPELARQMGIQGRVYIQFVIEKDGDISNISVLRGVDPLLDNEAIRVIEGIPNVIPAKQRGKPVRMSFVLPINAKMVNN